MFQSVLDDSKTEDKGEGDNSELSGDHSDAEEIKIEDKQSNLNEEQTVDQVEDTSKGDSNKKGMLNKNRRGGLLYQIAPC